MISAYIALRFEWKYAVPVLIALMHDLLITGGVYALTGREVTASTVAALLTILGFSLYDTIIVFDRIRENVPRMPRAAFSQIVNRSMSEVLTRSLATSFCTLLPILALYFFGGETLKDFAFALIVGTVSGTYSSVFIASPGAHALEGARAGLRAAAARGSSRSSAHVPAYATRSPAAPADVARPTGRKRARRLTTPDDPERQVSQDGVRRDGPRPARRRAARAHGDGRAPSPSPSRRDGDGDGRRQRRARPRPRPRPRGPRHEGAADKRQAQAAPQPQAREAR